MKTKYTRKQIAEAIEYWQTKLLEIDEDANVEVITDKEVIKSILPNIIDLVIRTYEPIGGFYGSIDNDKLIITTKIVKVVKNSDGQIAACAFYRDVQGSSKLQAYANDGTLFGKNGVKAIIKDDISPYANWVWAEVSGKVEHYFKKFGGFPLPNEFAAEVLEKKATKIRLSTDGFHYERIIGTSIDPVKKVIFGFKSKEIANKVMQSADYETRKDLFNTDLLKNESDSSRSDLDCAASFVNQLSDLYDEENLTQLTPGLSAEFDDSIEVLKAHVGEAEWISTTLELANYMRKKIPTVELFSSMF